VSSDIIRNGPKRRVERILRIPLNALASLDLVYDGQEKLYLITFSERNGGLRKRTVARIHEDQAMRIARFLAGIDEAQIIADSEATENEPTDPGRKPPKKA
jgi:uncharacterized protein (DUF2384 family)